MDVMDLRRRLMMGLKPSIVNINIWDEQWEIGAFSASNGLPTTPTESTLQIRTKNHIPVVAGATYYVYSGYANIRCLFYRNDDSFITAPSAVRETTITAPTNAAYMRFYTGNGYGRTYKNDISINYPPTETGYHQHI